MLDIKNLTADLGEFSLKGVDLHVDKGEYSVILGPTGTGKTILLEVIAGVYPVDGGSIHVNGQDITGLPPKDRSVSMVYQDYMLFPHLTIEENIRFGLEAENYPEEEISKRVDRFVDLLDISDILHRYSRTLSGGERQRATLARGLVMGPDVLLLDEPVSALDVPSQEKIIKELKKIRRETDVTIMHVTHSREEAIRLGDRIAVMNDGKIVQVGKSNQVFKKPISEFVADFVGIENVFEGKSRVDNEIARVELGDRNGIEVVSVSKKKGDVKVCIRPEEIILSRDPIDSSGRNTFEGKIIGLSERESTVQVKIDIGVDLIVTITKKSYSDMDLSLGDEIYLAFKATAVHLI